ncbi:MAG: non-ribosomal peptide synthetase, partial [bacterium]|nr:non-ribosomal peptide synthetase [bacterium]
TAEKFVKTPHLPVETVYRTGDMVKWLPGGDIEFLGRVDFQVKVRGNRIELEEIESRLIKHPGVKEAVINAFANDSGDNYLCAYMLEAEPGKTLGEEELREYLSGELPDYMVPTYFMWLASIPLNPSGKTDRKALPAPGLSIGENYTAPGDEIESQLTDLWSGVLGIERDIIGIDADFFALGGHSLKATVLAAKIHKALDVKVPLMEIFKSSTIRGLARYIVESVTEKYTGLEAVEKREYYPLSFAQKRLYILQQMELETTAYNLPRVMPLDMAVDKTLLEETFRKMIRRHESLRTSFIMVDEEPVQKIHDDVPFEIGLGEAPSLPLIPGFVGPFDLSKAPLLRVGLVKLDEEKYIFMMDIHHIITDGISQGIFEREFMELSANGTLAPLRFQYKDYSCWQNSEARLQVLKQQELYWRERFSGELPVPALPIDYARPAVQSFEGSRKVYAIGNDETAALKALAVDEGVTVYMVLSAVINLLLARLSGGEDIIIGTPTAGRSHADLQGIIGMFVNTLAMRNHPAGEKTVRAFLGEVKQHTLEAFENQDYPFEDLVEKVTVARDISRNPLFDVMFALQNLEDSADSTEPAAEPERQTPGSGDESG